MQEVLYIEDVDQAAALLKPQRIEMLKLMDRPRTCVELGKVFGETPQKIYYHVKAMEKAGLVVKTGERRVRGTVEGFYQAKARSYWLAPSLVSQVGGERLVREQLSLGMLLSLAEEIQEDIGHLAHESAREVPSLGLSAYIHLPIEARAKFLQEVQETFQGLARKYGLVSNDAPGQEQSDAGNTFRLVLACYPKDEPTLP
ncbi:MAG: helix-turn-helix domain-containing protein [Chloroflexota bacterium]|nr:helix-turn-helix domain-containing protein [Chloroflexota bacterium]